MLSRRGLQRDDPEGDAWWDKVIAAREKALKDFTAQENTN
jgi:hypothetical protein